MRSNTQLNQPSKKYQSSYKLIYEIDVNINKITDGKWDFLDKSYQYEEECTNSNQLAEEPYHNNRVDYSAFENEKYKLNKKINKLNKKIKQVDALINKIYALQTEESVDCCIGILTLCAAAGSFAESHYEANHGHIETSLLDGMDGILLTYLGSSWLDDAQDARKQITKMPSLAELQAVRNSIKKERRIWQKKLYEIEKNETLETLERNISKNSPLFLAINTQFEAITKAIEEDQFSKTYIDIAINTRNIITANTESKRHYYADQHVTMTTKQSIPKVVLGAVLVVAGIALGISLFVLALHLIGLGPIVAGFVGAMGAVVGGALITQGGRLINSGRKRERPKLLIQSIFNVVNQTKATPEMLPSIQPR